jgi:hypothetical protein
MTDIAVTIPRNRWQEFCLEPCAGGALRSYRLYGEWPPLVTGDFLFFVSHRRLRCAIEVERLVRHRGGCLVTGFFRPGITVKDDIAGFQGWRRVNFAPHELLAFAGWRRDGVTNFASRLSHLGPTPEPLPPYAHGKDRSQQGGSSA